MKKRDVTIGAIALVVLFLEFWLNVLSSAMGWKILKENFIIFNIAAISLIVVMNFPWFKKLLLFLVIEVIETLPVLLIIILKN